MGENTKGRPIKDGLEYFPFETDLFYDKKTRRLKAKFGAFGMMVYVYVLAEIYRERGYFLPLNSGEEDDDNITFEDFVFFIYEYFNEPGTSEELVKSILFYCLEINLFSKKMYRDYFILTSKGIQNRYFKVKRRPRGVNPKYIVPDLSEETAPPPIPGADRSDFGDFNSHILPLEEAFEKVRNDEFWINQVATSKNISAEKAKEHLEKFLKARIGDGDSHKNVLELKKHFNNWLAKAVEKENPQLDPEVQKLKEKYKNL